VEIYRGAISQDHDKPFKTRLVLWAEGFASVRLKDLFDAHIWNHVLFDSQAARSAFSLCFHFFCFIVATIDGNLHFLVQWFRRGFVWCRPLRFSSVLEEKNVTVAATNHKSAAATVVPAPAPAPTMDSGLRLISKIDLFFYYASTVIGYYYE
jgi:hypothetical protein